MNHELIEVRYGEWSCLINSKYRSQISLQNIIDGVFGYDDYFHNNHIDQDAELEIIDVDDGDHHLDWKFL